MDAYIDVVGANLREVLAQRRLRAEAFLRARDGIAGAGGPEAAGATSIELGSVSTGAQAARRTSTNPLLQAAAARSTADGDGDDAGKPVGAAAAAKPPRGRNFEHDMVSLVHGPPTPEHRVAHVGWLVRLQTQIADALRTSMWPCCLRNKKRVRAEWALSTVDRDGARSDTLAWLLADATKELADAEVMHLDPELGRVKLVFYTRTTYADIVDVSLVDNAATGECKAVVWSTSMGVAQMRCPLAAACAIGFCWFPFVDQGVNLQHVNALRETLTRQQPSIRVKQVVTIKGGARSKDANREGGAEDDGAGTGAGAGGGAAATAAGADGALTAAAGRIKRAATPGIVGWDPAPLLCFICGIALGTVWIGMSTSIVPLSMWMSGTISNQMQFAYNAPILLVVIFQNTQDRAMLAKVGWRAWYISMAGAAFLGNAMTMFWWKEWGITKPWEQSDRTALNVVSTFIGFFSSLGYGAFMLMVGSLSNSCNYAFRYGFMSSGIVNLLFGQATGWSTGRKHETSEKDYWDTSGAIAVLGFAAAAILVSRPHIEHALWAREQEALARTELKARASAGDEEAKKLVKKGRTMAQVVPEVWKMMLCCGLSFCAGMLVFVHFPFLPIEATGHLLPQAAVYINMFADVLGQLAYTLGKSGKLPHVMTTQGRVIAMTAFRLALLPLFFLYLKHAHAWGIVSDSGISIFIVVFVLTAGYTSAASFAVACDAVALPDRPAVATAMGVAIFLGLYPAFILGFAMADNTFSGFQPELSTAGAGM